MIRVLHSLSFVDDPTRILRAARFELRLGFTIEPRTAELIDTALPMLRRITGRRILNEMDLLLREIGPERALLSLSGRGALEAIHPDFQVGPEIAERFEAARSIQPSWAQQKMDADSLYWHAMMIDIPVSQLPGLLERLMIGRQRSTALIEAARLAQDPGEVDASEARPSQVVRRLQQVSDSALYAVWLYTVSPRIREHITTYMETWQHIQTATTGHTLRDMGILPGPHYSTILWRLRAGRLDGDIADDTAESAVLPSIIDQEHRSDSP